MARGDTEDGEALMRVRRALLGDVHSVARIHVEAWQAAYRGQVPDWYLDGLSVAQRADKWAEIMEQTSWPAQGLLVAENDDGDVVGFTHVAPSRDDDAGPETGEITAIYVDPAAWRTGVGRLLLQAASLSLHDAGLSYASLWVLEGNQRARRFYEQLGWEDDGCAKVDDRGNFTLAEVRLTKHLS